MTTKQKQKIKSRAGGTKQKTKENKIIQLEGSNEIKKLHELTPDERFKNDFFAQKWIETSIKLGTLEKLEITTSVNKLLDMTPESVRQKFYRDGYNNQEFIDYWHNAYADYYKSRSRAKVYRQIDNRIDKTRNLVQLVEAAKHLDNKPEQQQTQVNVNILNAIRGQQTQDIATLEDNL